MSGPRLLTKTQKDAGKRQKVQAAFTKFQHAKRRDRKGFDFPATLAGNSQWTGSDAKPVAIYYDPSINGGKDLAEAVLAGIDDVMRYCDWAFGVQGQGGNLIIAAVNGQTDGTGGAYHYGCDFATGGDWYIDAATDPQEVLGLSMAEISESYMGLQAQGWNCGGSGGEALSRLLAEIVSGGPQGALAPYSSAWAWDGSDWISKDQGTDQDYSSTGCGVLYLWWMISQGYTVDQITQAGESDGTLAGNYALLTGKLPGEAFKDFSAAMQQLGDPASFADDNPMKAPLPPYPLNGGGNGGGGNGGGDLAIDVPELSVTVAGQQVATIPAFTISGQWNAGKQAIGPAACTILQAMLAAFCGSNAKNSTGPGGKKNCNCK